MANETGGNQLDTVLRAIEGERSRLDFATRGVQVITSDDAFSARLASDVVFTDATLLGALIAMRDALAACATRDDAVVASAAHAAKRYAMRRAAKRAALAVSP